MICISGIPGSGKSTVSEILSARGFRICDAAVIAENTGCRDGDEVDIDCLRERGDFRNCDAVQGHYSHLLSCDSVFILTADEETLRSRLKKRGYAESKIEENLDAQMAGITYYESLERLPATRIHFIDTSGSRPEETARTIEDALTGPRKI